MCRNCPAAWHTARHGSQPSKTPRTPLSSGSRQRNPMVWKFQNHADAWFSPDKLKQHLQQQEKIFNPFSLFSKRRGPAAAVGVEGEIKERDAFPLALHQSRDLIIGLRLQYHAGRTGID